MTDRFCKNCANCIPSDHEGIDSFRFARCRLSPNGDYAVIGDVPSAFEYCSLERLTGRKCGPDGLKFQPIMHPVAA
jgi:hypothetical protein